MLNIVKLDTNKKEVKIIVDNNVYSPFVIFNPTHISNYGKINILIRFGKEVDIGIIKKLPFKTINHKKIVDIKKLGKLYESKNGMTTGNQMPLFVFESNSENNTNCKWIMHGNQIRIEDNIVDFEYVNSKIKYEDYYGKN